MTTAVADAAVTVVDDGGLSLELEEGPEAGQLKAPAETWSWLFGTDPDGDSNLANVLRYIAEERPDLAERALEGARAFARQLTAGKAEVDPADGHARAVKDRYRRLLSSQLPARLWHRATREERERLVEDCYDCCHVQGLNFERYRASLAGTNSRDDLGCGWATAREYLAAV